MARAKNFHKSNLNMRWKHGVCITTKSKGLWDVDTKSSAKVKYGIRKAWKQLAPLEGGDGGRGGGVEDGGFILFLMPTFHVVRGSGRGGCEGRDARK